MHLGDYGCPVPTKELSLFVQDKWDINGTEPCLSPDVAEAGEWLPPASAGTGPSVNLHYPVEPQPQLVRKYLLPY